MCLRRRRLCARHRQCRGVQRHRRLRPDQRGHRPLPRRSHRQRRRLHRRPASDHRGRHRLVPGGVRRRAVRLVREVHQAGARLDVDRVRPTSGVSRRAQLSAGRGAGRDSDQHPLPPGRSGDAAPRCGGVRSRRAALAGRSRRGGARDRVAARCAAAADRRRRRRVLVRCGRRAARVRQDDGHTGVLPPRGAGRGAGGRRAGGARGVEEAVHRTRRRGARGRVQVLERGAFRCGADVERTGDVHPGRCDAGGNRLAGPGRGRDRRRCEARARPTDRRRTTPAGSRRADRNGARKSRPRAPTSSANSTSASGAITARARSTPTVWRAISAACSIPTRRSSSTRSR